MKKWEYGIIKRSTVITKTKWSSVEGYYEVKLNEQSIVTCAIESNPARNQEEDLLLLAFNKLGSMGWELCSDNLVYYLSSGGVTADVKKAERIIFRREIE